MISLPCEDGAMTDTSSGVDPLGQLADDFLQRYRRGERPALTEYAQRHPELAEQIRELFPALVMMEDVRPSADSATGPPRFEGPERLGEYRIVREIGRGGMGIVYEAEQESLGRRVALKVLPATLHLDTKHIRRFQHEARAAARLHHTSIVPVFGVGEENGTHYYVMQYIEGCSLSAVLAELRNARAKEAAPTPLQSGTRAEPLSQISADVARSILEGRFHCPVDQSMPSTRLHSPDGPPHVTMTKEPPACPPSPVDTLAGAAPPSGTSLTDPRRPYAKTIAHIGVQVADALEYAATQGVLHRDVKPSNLLLDVWGAVWLTDFGLAKASGTDDLTGTGDVLGTLRYMAPERFRGRADVRSDVYSLGLTLYELLALQPAFEDADEVALVMQISTKEPPRLDKLNLQLPQDIVTIVHKAMAKDPADRYQTAGALAEDLRRFIDDRPILARRIGPLEQVRRWCRRKPAMASLLVSVLTLALLATGSGVWLVRQEVERRAEARRQEESLRKDVGTALAQAVNFRQGYHFREGRDVLHQASQRVEAAGPDDLRRQVNQAQADLDLAERLDAARLQAATNVDGKFDFAGADQQYAAAFAEAGLGHEGDDVETVAARVKASAVREALVAALDDWAVCVADNGRSAWMLQVAWHADPDPGGWRDRVRDPVKWADAVALAELARTAPVADQPVPLLLALAQRLQATGGNAPVFLRRVQREYPDDFWANLALGNSLKYWGAGEAIGYYRVALAIRPRAWVSYYNLAEVLSNQGWFDEAIDYYSLALRLDATNAWVHLGRGNALAATGRTDEALDDLRKVVQIDANNIQARLKLGAALKDKGRLDEARDYLQQAVTRDPKNADAQNALRGILIRQGRGEEVLATWKKSLEANPHDHDAWFGYAELCLFLRHEDEYHHACRALLGRFGMSPDPYVAERTGRSCLLLPASEEELWKAGAIIDRTRNPLPPEYDWAAPYFHFALGLAEYRRGRLDGAIYMMSGDAGRVMQPAPLLVVAMAQHRQGQKETARKTLAAAVLDYDWRADHADRRDAWISHILRREAEAMILPNLPAFLEGKYQPQYNDERLAMLGACQFRGRYRAAARLYADAFAADQTVADNFQAGRRYHAARCAALAAAGQGKDSQKLDDRERAGLRRQALDWLRADLTAWAKTNDRALAQKNLRSWQQDADLSGVRDKSALAKLAATERNEWSRLWSDVADLLEKTGRQQ
jgi:serine/threonine-protein kinase